jgi:hypothetical protein
MTIKAADVDHFQYQAIAVQFGDRFGFLKKKRLKNNF